jgi:predicted permease
MSAGYRVLLRLLPRRRRDRDGASMALVFDELRQATRRDRGWLALGVLWMKETGGLVRFGWRERFRRRAAAAGSHPPPDRGRWDVVSELKWAWRAVRARGWRAGLAAGLLAIALAANTVVFSAADALVFNRVPYANLDRLAWFGSASPTALAEWRKQTDLFDAVHGYTTRPVFATSQHQPAIIDVVDVTPGLLDMLGAFPRWGRALNDADARESGVEVAVISERLARLRFSTPAAAVGQRIETTATPILVAGVMPDWFRFPAGSYDIWRVIDLTSGRYRFVFTVARLTPGRPLGALASIVQDRAAAIAPPERTVSKLFRPTLQPLSQSRIDDEPRRLLFIVVGAALCLLLTACANIASLELAGAVSRIRSFGIRVALGASRGSLVRGALFEGLFVLVPAVIIAAGLATLGTNALASRIPERVFDSMNPIDVDGRALGWMSIIALVIWILVAIPVALFSSRRTVIDAVRAEGRSISASRAGGRLRAVLTSAEVALAVLLLAGGLLYARTYQSLVALDKGFDSRNLSILSLTLPTQSYPTPEATRLLEGQVMSRLRARPDVVDVSAGFTFPPGLGESHQAATLEVDGQPAGRESLSVGVNRIDENLFRTMRIPLRAGRPLEAGAPPDEAVVDESFAHAFWPGADAVGRRFRISNAFPTMTVVGIAGHVRHDTDSRTGPSDRHYRIYLQRQPPKPRPALTGSITEQPLYGSLQFALRLDSRAAANEIFSDIRAIDSRFRLRLQSMDEIYNSRHDATLFATRVVGSFAILAFVLAIAGVYGVMAFLVAGRTREIGIRLALGATAHDISRLVMRSSGTMVAIGAVAGVAAALLATRWTGSQFFGVAPTDPGTYVLVTATVIATSLMATWRPARAAARIDPAVTLKTE